jgi:phospholipase/lecithinase/hemolysin
MKDGQQPFNHTRLLRTAIAGAALALLAACGGGGSSSSSSTTTTSSTPASGVNLQVVSFGTSLSDAGTYSPEISIAFGGGRFTTNPGQVWTQNVSTYFGNTLTPAYEGGFGVALSATGGYDYSQGGAQVSLGGNIDATSATEMPVTWQIKQYLSQHSSFNSSQLVLVEGGANEILNFAQDSTFASFGTAFETAASSTAGQTAIGTIATNLITAGTFPNTAAGQKEATAVATAEYMIQFIQTEAASSPTSYPLATDIILAAQTLAQQVATQILANGATKIAVVNVPDIGETPAAVVANASNSGASTLLTLITLAYNLTLQTALETAAPTAIANKQIVQIDTFSWIDSVVANYAADGFTVSNTATACNLTQMEANATAYATANPSVLTGTGLTAAEYGAQFGSSLFCSPQTLVASNAATTYMFADSVHPTTALHALFANYVETQLAAAGIGKAP